MKKIPNPFEPSRPLPFECTIYDGEPVSVTNPFNSGKSCTIPKDAVAVFNTVIVAEKTNHYDLVRAGCDWFRKYFPEEYYILLD